MTVHSQSIDAEPALSLWVGDQAQGQNNKSNASNLRRLAEESDRIIVSPEG